MTAAGIKSYIFSTIVIIAGLAVAGYTGRAIENTRPGLPEGYSDTDLAVHGARLKGFSFGMEGLLSDWYYMRSLQYIGDKVLARGTETIDLDNLRSLNPRLLYPLLDNATSLDPHFLGAFYYGAVILPAVDGGQAIALTEKGIRHNPDAWRLYQHLGYIYWKLGRYDEAANAYEKGSSIHGAAPFMRLMAGSLRTEGGSRATARRIFEQMLEGTDDPAVRITAQRRLAQIESLDEQDAVNDALATYRSRSGKCPANLNEIVPTLVNIQLPGNNAFQLDAADRLADPTGAPYLLDAANCRVKIDESLSDLPKQ